MNMLSNISNKWREFWKPVPPVNDVYVKWELRPVQYRVQCHEDGRITWKAIENTEEEHFNYGGTD